MKFEKGEPQAGIPWIYPDGSEEWKEGADIIAKFEFNGVPRCEELVRCGWNGPHGEVILAWKGCATKTRYADDQLTIIAYIPYTKPNPPGKPQDCPFCGSEMRTYQNCYYNWISVCKNDDCQFRTPCRETKAGVIKALNSVRVVKE